MASKQHEYRERQITVTAVDKGDGRYGWEYLIDGTDRTTSGRRTVPSEAVALAEGLNAAMTQIDDDFFREMRTS